MSNCTFQQNEQGLWQCSECGWVYPKESEKPPRRNCPKGKPSRTFDTMLQARFDNPLATRPRALVYGLLELCEEQCGNTGSRRCGLCTGCDGTIRYIQHLTDTNWWCDNWD